MTATQTISAPLPAPPAPRPRRLISLDAFRGLVIVSMLVVNNLGDWGAVSWWWKHVNWIQGTQGQAYANWWAAMGAAEDLGGMLGHLAVLPLFQHCTLADFVMPWFILIIGVAIPFSVAASVDRGVTPRAMWAAVIRRSAMLVVLGWAIDASLRVEAWHHGSNPDAVLRFTLGMNVLQLLGVSYLAARVFYLLPLAPRMGAAVLLFIGHWALLRFYPQPLTDAGGGVGSFTASHNAVGYIYANWAIFQPFTLTSFLDVSARGMISVIPVTATMLLGTWIGHLMRQERSPESKAKILAIAGVVTAAAGFLWAFDLPFNKPVWTGSYLLYTSGVAAILIAGLHLLVDPRGIRWWNRPFVVFGLNSIAAYWISIMFKIWILNMPRVSDGEGGTMMLTRVIVSTLQEWLGRPGGSWAFTILFVMFWWMVFEFAYRRRIFWKL